MADGASADAAFIGGPTAEAADLRTSSARDNLVIIPLILIVVAVILAFLLRAVVAPLLLVATVVLSFGAALGVSSLVFDYIFGFAGESPGLALFAFAFLVALGADYNIFLMARVREETADHDTRVGTVRALAATGSVITAAGIVLAGTFSVLGVLPLVALTQIGFVVALGCCSTRSSCGRSSSRLPSSTWGRGCGGRRRWIAGRPIPRPSRPSPRPRPPNEAERQPRRTGGARSAMRSTTLASTGATPIANTAR